MTSDNELELEKIEKELKALINKAGLTLLGYFGKPLKVEYKDAHNTDPVTEVDRSVQDFLKKSIKEVFPDHSVIGEEDSDISDEPLSKFIWVIDPLDGTRNFSQGLPIFACSIGVLKEGKPVAGAIFIPASNTNGNILHAVHGKGAYINNSRIKISKKNKPKAGSLSGLPGSFNNKYWFSTELGRIKGETRVLGSIAYELAMVASGVLQYSALLGSLAIWDVAAGAIIIQESGGSILVGNKGKSKTEWTKFESFYTKFNNQKINSKNLRQWRKPMIFGSDGIVDFISKNIKVQPYWKRQLRHLIGL